jgi:hypothetical protein
MSPGLHQVDVMDAAPHLTLQNRSESLVPCLNLLLFSFNSRTEEHSRAQAGAAFDIYDFKFVVQNM